MAIWCGIDIGTAAVKVAVVRSAYRKTTVEALVSAEIIEGEGVEAALSTAVMAAFGGKLSGYDGLAVALEGSKATVRLLTLPANAAKQLTEVMAFELEAQVPIDMDESVFDYRTLEVNKPTDKDDGIRVLSAAARTADVKALIDLVKSSIDGEPERVGVGPFALANLVPYIPPLAETDVTAIVDLGKVSSDVLILKGGEPLFVRTLSFGTEGLPGTAARLAREIRLSFASHRASGGDTPVALFLCGGGAFVSGAESFLGAELEMPVSILPQPNLEMALLDPNRAAEVPRFAKAIGLALALGTRGAAINLRRGPLTYERGFAWIREKVPMLAGLGAVIFISFLFSGWAQLFAIGKDEDVSAKALAMVTKDVLGEETTSPARARELLAKQTSLSDEDPMPHADAFDVMAKLADVIPSSMVHDIEELDVQKGHVIVHGIVGSIPDAQSIAQSLRSDPCFQEVKITRTTQMVGGDRQKYVLEMDQKCPEDVKTKKKESSSSSAGTVGSAAQGGKEP